MYIYIHIYTYRQTDIHTYVCIDTQTHMKATDRCVRILQLLGGPGGSGESFGGPVFGARRFRAKNSRPISSCGPVATSRVY